MTTTEPVSGRGGPGLTDVVVEGAHAAPRAPATLDTPTVPAGPPGSGTVAAPPATPERSARQYMPGLDGIRGVAMAAMLMYHHGFQFVHGAMFTVSTFFTLSRFLIATVVLGEKARTQAGVARQVLRAAGPAAAARGAGRAGRGRHDPVAVRRGLRAVPGRRPGRPRLHDQLAAGGLGVGLRGHVPGRGADPALLVSGHRGAVLPGLPVPAAGGAVPDPAPAGLAGGLLAALAAGSFALAWVSATDNGNTGITYYATYSRVGEILGGVALALVVARKAEQASPAGPGVAVTAGLGVAGDRLAGSGTRSR